MCNSKNVSPNMDFYVVKTLAILQAGCVNMDFYVVKTLAILQPGCVSLRPNLNFNMISQSIKIR